MNKSIYQIISESGKSKMSILDFKKDYSPIELSTELTHLVKSGIASLNWDTNEITLLNFTVPNLVANRNTKDTERKIPENMKEEKIEVNKPTLEF
jgi:hypothetical protein